jgi:hypothetical protein
MQRLQSRKLILTAVVVHCIEHTNPLPAGVGSNFAGHGGHTVGVSMNTPVESNGKMNGEC